MNGATVKVYSKAKDGNTKLSANFKVREFACLDGTDTIFVSDELVNITLSAVSDFISTAQLCVIGCNMTEDAPKTVREYLYNRKD